MVGNVNPGDHHSMGGADFLVLRESPVYVLCRLEQNTRTGVLTEVDLAHTITCVEVSLQSCNHAEFWGHVAKIVQLTDRLCCGNKTIGVDLKLKAGLTGMRMKRNEIIITLHGSLIIIRLTIHEKLFHSRGKPSLTHFDLYSKLIRLMIQFSHHVLKKALMNEQQMTKCCSAQILHTCSLM